VFAVFSYCVLSFSKFRLLFCVFLVYAFFGFSEMLLICELYLLTTKNLVFLHFVETCRFIIPKFIFYSMIFLCIMAPPFEVDLDKIQEIIDEIAPELADSWVVRNDLYEDEGIRTGRLHENHILGILLGCDFIDKEQLTTTNIEKYYEGFFKKIARSTVSTYLNQLDKEGVLGKERKGRIVYYYIKEQPPYDINPFWVVRNFCIIPPYFIRTMYLCRFYKAETDISKDLIESRRFIVGLAILTLLRNRFQKCMLCQFASRKDYEILKEKYDTIIKDRKDVLPEMLQSFINELGEIPIFGGIKIPEELTDEEVNKKIDDLTVRYAQDIDFQMSVSRRRQELRLKQKSRSKGKASAEESDEKVAE